jgi:hypothetical protein
MANCMRVQEIEADQNRDLKFPARTKRLSFLLTLESLGHGIDEIQLEARLQIFREI